MSILLVFFLLVLVLAFVLFRPAHFIKEAQFEVRKVAHSISEAGIEIMTVYARYPRFIHAEVMTHKDFSRSASSSRAIPVKKVLQQVWNNPATPINWGCNIPGMQAKTELSGWKRNVAINVWHLCGKTVCIFAWTLMKVGLHKQVANRVLEPWQYIHVVITATNWKNFYNLRCHPDAQPEINYLANLIRTAQEESPPTLLSLGEWHLPWIDQEDVVLAIHYLMENYRSSLFSNALPFLKKQSAARCARTSYATFDGKRSTLKDDIKLCDQLFSMRPVHASPAEHQATPDYCIATDDPKPQWSSPELHGNLRGWIQYRKQIPDHYLEG